MSTSTPTICELWVRSRGDGVLDGASAGLRENAGAEGQQGGPLYFRFAGLSEGKAASPAGCCLHLEVPALGKRVLLPEALSGPFSPRTRLQLERMHVPAYAVTGSSATAADWDRAQRFEGQDRHGRPLSLTGLFTVAADLERALGSALVVSYAPCISRAGRRDRDRYDGVTRRRCGRGAKRPRRSSGPGQCQVPSAPTTPCSDAADAQRARPSSRSYQAASSVGLGDLVEGPYSQVASYMDLRTLCRADAASRALRAASCAQGGLWRAWGGRVFHGVELWETESHRATFEPSAGRVRCWKERFSTFAQEVATFRPPFGGTEIQSLDHAEECAQLRCRLNAEALSDPAGRGVFLEVEVLCNPDHVTLALVDWDAGGRSSVTFSPTTGTVFRERIVGDAPRRIRGDYVQRLYAALPGVRFEGSVGLYVQGGRLAFFRRWRNNEADDFAPEQPVWETTGFVTDLSWAQGPHLTPCLAFCKEGPYHVHSARVVPEPPMLMQQVPAMCDEAAWKRFDWE